MRHLFPLTRPPGAAPIVFSYLHRVTETHTKEMTMSKAKAATATLDHAQANPTHASDLSSLRARFEQLRIQERSLTEQVIALEQSGGRDQAIGHSPGPAHGQADRGDARPRSPLCAIPARDRAQGDGDAHGRHRGRRGRVAATKSQ